MNQIGAESASEHGNDLEILDQARKLWTVGNAIDALALCNHIVSKRSDLANAHALRAVLLAATGRPFAAIRAYRDFFTRFPKEEQHPNFQTRPDNIGWALQNALTRSHAETGQRVSAIILTALCLLSASAAGLVSIGDWQSGAILLLAGMGIPILLEVGFRIFLFRSHGIPGERTVAPIGTIALPTETHFIDAAPVSFNSRHGYDYLPKARCNRYVVADDKLIACRPCASNSLGNAGTTEASGHEQFRIFVFGDSFTAYFGTGVSNSDNQNINWPDLLQEELRKKFGPQITVTNFGREGHGILQMVEMAADKVAQSRPDLVLIGFISDDLVRTRFWCATRFVHGQERWLRLPHPDQGVALHDCMDLMLVESRANSAWAAERIKIGDRDALLDEVMMKYRSLQRRVHPRSHDILALDVSFFLRRLLFGDALVLRDGSIGRKQQYIEYRDYQDDPAFGTAARRLKKSGVALELIHLPNQREFHFRQVARPTEVSIALWDSLELALGKNIKSLITTARATPAEIRRFRITPADRHPGLGGMRLYVRGLMPILTPLITAQLAQKRPEPRA